MKKVIGLGGIFVKAKDPRVLAKWYEQHLGISFGESPYVVFPFKDDQGNIAPGYNILSFFKEDTDYFDPSRKDVMINLRVEDLFALIDQLKKEGVQIAGDPIDEEYGKFGWIMDPEGNKVELWQPPDEK
jgi:predicted enzyme related to lactoylglutathione lyase